eukprot:jgi/Mesvir1/20609/Mv14837-RA.1
MCEFLPPPPWQFLPPPPPPDAITREKLCLDEANAMSRGLLLFLRDKRCAAPGFFASSYDGCPSGVRVCGCLKKQLSFLRAYIPNLARLGANCRDVAPSNASTDGGSNETDSTGSSSIVGSDAGGSIQVDDPYAVPYSVDKRWSLLSNGSFINLKVCPPGMERRIYERCGLYEGKYGFAALKKKLDNQTQELIDEMHAPPSSLSGQSAASSLLQGPWPTLRSALLASLGWALAMLLL